MSIPTLSATSGCSSWSKQFQHGVSQEPPSPTLKGLLQSMEQDEAVSNVASGDRDRMTQVICHKNGNIWRIYDRYHTVFWVLGPRCMLSKLKWKSVLVMYPDYPPKNRYHPIIPIIPIIPLFNIEWYKMCVCVPPLSLCFSSINQYLAELQSLDTMSREWWQAAGVAIPNSPKNFPFRLVVGG